MKRAYESIKTIDLDSETDQGMNVVEIEAPIPTHSILNFTDMFMNVCKNFSDIKDLIRLEQLSTHHYNLIRTNNFTDITVHLSMIKSSARVKKILFNYQFKYIDLTGLSCVADDTIYKIKDRWGLSLCSTGITSNALNILNQKYNHIQLDSQHIIRICSYVSERFDRLTAITDKRHDEDKLVLLNPNLINAVDNDGSNILIHLLKECPKVPDLLLRVRFVASAGINLNLCDRLRKNALSIAACNGNYDVVEFLLKAGANVNARNEHNQIPLHEAITKKHIDIAYLLLEYGSECNVIDITGWSPLILAAEKKNYNLCEVLIARGSDVNFIHTDDWNAFKMAVCKKNLSVASLLVANGADIFATISHTILPLHLAAEQQDMMMVNFLLAKGFDINSKDRYGSTPLMKATKSKDPIGIIDHLIKLGADPILTDNIGRTALLFAIDNKKGIVEILNLISLGLDINNCTKYGENALMAAIRAGDLGIINYMVKNIRDINHVSTGDNVYSALMLALAKKLPNGIIISIIERGADVGWVCPQRHNALLTAILHCYDQEMISYLIKNGADVNYAVKTQYNILSYAIEHHPDIVDFLIDEGADCTFILDRQINMLTWGLINGIDSPALTRIVDASNNLDTKTDTSISSLTIALCTRNNEIVEGLVDLGVDLSDCVTREQIAALIKLPSQSMVTVPDPLQILNGSRIASKVNQMTFFTPLGIAIYYGSESVVSAFMRRDIDLNNKNLGNDTCLKIAIRKTDHVLLEILLTHGADPNVVTCGTSALTYALAFLCRSTSMAIIIETLLKGGANPNAMIGIKSESKSDSEELPVLMYAIRLGLSLNIITLLLKYGADPNIGVAETDADTPIISTALKLALNDLDNVDMVKLLLTNGADHSVIELDAWLAYTTVLKDQRYESVAEEIEQIVLAKIFEADQTDTDMIPEPMEMAQPPQSQRGLGMNILDLLFN